MKALIVCERGLEECEALIVYDLLTRAGIKTVLAGPAQYITSSHNLTFKIDEPLGLINSKEYNCLILPGGMPGTTNLQNNKDVDKLIDDFTKEGKLICAICAAPSILLNKGLLKDNEFTCFPGFEGNHKSTNEKVHVHKNYITGKGMGCAVEFGLKIIEVLLGSGNSEAIKKKIQY